MSKVLFSLICRSVSWNKKFSFPHIWARADRLFFSKNYMLRLHVCSKIIIVGYSKTIRTWHDHMNAFVYVRYEKCSTTWSKHFRTDAKYGIYKTMGAYYNSIFFAKYIKCSWHLVCYLRFFTIKLLMLETEQATMKTTCPPMDIAWLSLETMCPIRSPEICEHTLSCVIYVFIGKCCKNFICRPNEFLVHF